MKTKAIFLSLAMVFSLAIVAHASTSAKPGKTLASKFRSELSTSGIDFAKYNGETMNIRFEVDEAGELRIISTNNKELDAAIKGSLNKQKVLDARLVPYTTYKVNVTFKSKGV